MGLKESCEEHKRQRLIRRHQLATSKDQKVRAIHNEFVQSQRRRDKTDEMKSKQLATYDPKKKKKKKQRGMSGKTLVKWKSFGQKRRFVRLLANPVMGQELASEFVDIVDLGTDPRQNGGSCCLFSKRSANRKGW